MISENLKTFYGLPVEDYEAGKPLTAPAGTACRVRLTWEQHDEGAKFNDQLDALLSDPAAGQLKALVIGDWGGVGEVEQLILGNLLRMNLGRGTGD